MRAFLPVGILFVFFALSFPACAAEAASGGVEEVAKIEAQLQKQSQALMKGMNEKQSSAFARIGTNFGMIRAVSIVRKDVSHAVKKCGETHADLNKEITGRFSQWDKKISPLIKKNEAKMRESVNGGLFKDPAKVTAYLNKVDALAVKSDSKIDKQVLTDEDSCKDLLDSLDDTEDTISEILEDMEWPDSPAKPEKK